MYIYKLRVPCIEDRVSMTLNRKVLELRSVAETMDSGSTTTIIWYALPLSVDRIDDIGSGECG